uniref:SCO2322 family protein n=1 Tax=Streptomyces sp. NBC_00003 TaxID=2903608 RepID=A0AAU2V9X9_9ACTN
MRTRLASSAALILALLLALVALAAGTGSAQAAGYRYWSFWDLTGANWTYATQGPASAHPGDGSVQGFRFAVSADSKDASRPRTTPSFEAVCGATPTKDGTKRVALVIDFGTPQDAPQGETPPAPRTACAQVSPDATSADALAAAAKPLRYNSAALLCAIADYPRTGCGEQVANPSTPKAEPAKTGKTGNDSGPSVGLLAGVAAVVALGAAAIWQSRRRKN